MGAAGRDFHNFNVVYRDDPATEVVAFTAAQIPGIGGRRYPSTLAGPAYPAGIPIVDEAGLEDLCRSKAVERVVFAYSDVTHQQLMHAASRALGAGADFALLGPTSTMLASRLPVIAVTAIRTGCGKSQTARHVCDVLRARGLSPVVIRHPMPYGDLEQQRVQRFASTSDLDQQQCTNEEREEYEPHIAAGNIVYAGVDTAAVIAAAEQEADILVWDGGNNDFSFIRPDLNVVIADALRPGQATGYYPGEAALRMADVIVLNKVDAASPEAVAEITAELRAVNANASLVRAASPVTLSDPDAVRGRRVLVVEDGPTITHGGQPHGAGYVAARQGGAAEIVDPRALAHELIRDVYTRYPHIGPVLPNVGYSEDQRAALRQTIAASGAEVVVVAPPIDADQIVPPGKTSVRADYRYADVDEPRLTTVLDRFLSTINLPRTGTR